MDEVGWETLLAAYRAGLFPMASSRDSAAMEWYSPLWRGVLPLDGGFHVPRSLGRFMRRSDWQVTTDRAFAGVIGHCATVRAAGRDDSWISHRIEALYTELHRRGHAHSVEVWEDGALIGGLYGVHIGAAFFGESMFSLRPNASKVALVRLVEGLRQGGFRLLDAQYVNDHLKQFGICRISRQEYRRRLAAALAEEAVFQGFSIGSARHSSTTIS